MSNTLGFTSVIDRGKYTPIHIPDAMWIPSLDWMSNLGCWKLENECVRCVLRRVIADHMIAGIELNDPVV